jgi:hypothetical protein
LDAARERALALRSRRLHHHACPAEAAAKAGSAKEDLHSHGSGRRVVD